MLPIYGFHIDFEFWTEKCLPWDLQMSQTPRYLFSGLASLWMDGFSVSLSQMIPHVYDRLLDGSGFEYLQVCAFGTPLMSRRTFNLSWPNLVQRADREILRYEQQILVQGDVTILANLLLIALKNLFSDLFFFSSNCFQVVFAGDAAVGKTSFINRITKGVFIQDVSSTLGVDFQIKVLISSSKTIGFSFSHLII